MEAMFASATSFNQPLNSWNVSAVTNMVSMFDSATAFNQPLNLWDTSAVNNMYGMFNENQYFNQDISGWDVSAVTDMGRFMGGKSTADYDYYDNLLNAWSLLTLQNDVTWSMGSIEYTSAGATARQDIIDNYSWNIEDGGEI
jgi:surface protein